MKNYGVYFLKAGKAEIRELELRDPSPDQVQVKCVANGICMGEVSIFNGSEHPQFPCLVGHEGLAVVTKVGANVKHLKEGDWVPSFKWALYDNLDTHYAFKFTSRIIDPAVMLTEPVSCVVTALYSYDITPGDRVLLLGAGYMGLLNVQGLSHAPICELVVTDVKPRNLELARKFGATEVIQTGTPAGDARLEELRKRRFDLVIEAAGVEPTVRDAGDFVRGGGRLAIFAWHHAPRTLDLGLWHMRGITVLNSAPGIGIDHNTNSFERAVRLMDRGWFNQTELISHRHPVSDVQNAMELAAQRGDGYIKGVLTFEA